MEWFDRIVDAFSARELSARVRGVILVGVALCALFALALGLLLTSTQRIALVGTARWSQEIPGALAISIETGPIQTLLEHPTPTLELLDPAHGRVRVESTLLGIDAQTNVAQLHGAAVPDALHALPRMDARIIILEKPMWHYLWGK
jgi:hypothetical protein